MSYQLDGVCYSTVLQATQAAGAREVGKVVNIGTAAYVVDVTNTTDYSITYRFTNVSSASTISKTVQISPQPCGLLQVADAVQIGWAIALVWCAVYALTFITDYLKGEIAGIQNDA